MDLDAYSTAHREDWQRLSELARSRSLTGEEIDELVSRYRAGAAELSAIRSTSGSSRDGDRLSVSLSRARLRFTGAATDGLTRVSRFFVLSLPAAFHRVRWIALVVAIATIAVSWIYAAWLLDDPRSLANFGTEAQLKQLVETDFAGYYSENPAASFAGQVWTNNAWIAAQCLALGIVGLYVPYLLLQNAQNLGVSAAVLFHYDAGDTFLLYIAPHGLLELTAVFFAAAGGLRIFWAWIAPGARTRGQALAEDARSIFALAIGLTVVLFVSGIIEGFVTPSSLSWPVKIGIGALALAAFLFYVIVIGGRARRAGETGDLDPFEAGARTVVDG